MKVESEILTVSLSRIVLQRVRTKETAKSPGPFRGAGGQEKK